MKITKGTLLKIEHSRKGKFRAVAERDFDTEKEEFYPVAVALMRSAVQGMVNEWETGESIPCRASLCKIEII